MLVWQTWFKFLKNVTKICMYNNKTKIKVINIEDSKNLIDLPWRCWWKENN